jgi:hypothetical protein
VQSTRRRLLRAAMTWPAVEVLQAARKEFWDSKDPAAWSAAEKERLLQQSPWAREGVARFAVELKRGPGNGAVERPGAGVPGARPGGTPEPGASVPIGEAPPRAPSMDAGQPVQFRVLARWESAQPVRLAGGPELPPETAGFYVIRLRGMPLLPPRKDTEGQTAPNANQATLEAIRQNSRLERKDKNAIACAHVLTGSGDSATDVLLFFARAPDPITLADKSVTLVSGFGPFQLALKFPLKEMMYKGALSL